MAKFSRIKSSRSRSKFGPAGPGQNLEVFDQVDPDPNLTALGWVDPDKIWPYSAETTLIENWPYSIESAPTESQPSLSYAEIWFRWPRQKICQILWCRTYGHKFVLKNSIYIYFMKNGFWILNLIHLFGSGFKLDKLYISVSSINLLWTNPWYKFLHSTYILRLCRLNHTSMNRPLNTEYWCQLRFQN